MRFRSWCPIGSPCPVPEVLVVRALRRIHPSADDMADKECGIPPPLAVGAPPGVTGSLPGANCPLSAPTMMPRPIRTWAGHHRIIPGCYGGSYRLNAPTNFSLFFGMLIHTTAWMVSPTWGIPTPDVEAPVTVPLASNST